MRVSNPPTNPTLLFDGECGFCSQWVARLAESAKDVDTRPYQEALQDFEEVPEEDCAKAVHYVERNGDVHSGADAAFQFWSASGRLGRLARWGYGNIPGMAWVSERSYKLLSASRTLTSLTSRELWGNQMLRPRFRVSGDIFLRCLGLIYVGAFLSLVLQVRGLIGSEGILPVEETLKIIQDRFGVSGYFEFPSLLWLDASDTALIVVCLIGTIAGLVGIIAPYIWSSWIVSWFAYLSLVSVGRIFMRFQWDAFLLETGFLAIIHVLLHARGLATGSERRAHTFSASPEPTRAIGFLYRWLLFRLMFSSGVVKLASNDETWWSLSALTRHYETQPLPNIFAWYAHHLPARFHTISCILMFVIELAIPFLFFAPRRLRHIAAFLTIGFQTLIFITGNYTFFNLLTIALCLWLIEDVGWSWRITERFTRPLSHRGATWLRHILGPAICVNLVLSSMILTRGAFRQDIHFPDIIHKFYEAISPYRVLNSYGLFAAMTTERPEIILEGSADGISWQSYEFYYKPGDVHRHPPFVAPHQPRLDWQMWFAALGPIRNSAWFHRFTKRLFEGSVPVRQLLSQDPFPDIPPRYLRARVFNYRFASKTEHALDGVWWKRTFSHLYLPPIVRHQR
jgi:predicted DCC family thiol-disulfide oxidoreductase YuxK